MMNRNFNNIQQFIANIKATMNGKNYRKINGVKYYYHKDIFGCIRIIAYDCNSGESETIIIGSNGAYHYYLNGDMVK